MPIAYFDDAGTAASAGIFIPRDNIAGLIIASELAASEPEIKKQCKFLAGFLTTLQDAIETKRAIANSLVTALGFTVTKSNPAGVGVGIFSQAFTVNIAQVIDYSNQTFYPIPVPTSGTNTGRGVLKIIDVFPDAIAVASAGAISEAGILIPHSDINGYGSESTTDPTDDEESRKWFAAMGRYLFDQVPIRVANTTVSALTTKTLGAVAPFTLPTDALAASNPTTGLTPSEATVNDIYSRSIQFTIQYLLNETTQTFDVYVV
jgi:hypothetical protein